MVLYLGSTKVTPTITIYREGLYGATVKTFLGEVDNDGVLQMSNTATALVFDGVTDIASGVLRNVFGDSSGYAKPNNITSVSFPDLTSLSGTQAMAYAFYKCTNLTSVDLSSLTTVSGASALQNAFQGCTSLVGALDLSSLTTVTGSGYVCYATFYGCTGITSVDLSSLTTVTGNMINMFGGCTNLTGAIDLSSLETVSGNGSMSSMFTSSKLTSANLSSLETVSTQAGLQYIFSGCSNFVSVDLSSLTTLTGSKAMSQTFRNTALTTLSFPSLNSSSFGSYTNQFNNMLQGVTGCTVHFPSNLQSVIGNWTDVTNGFGGTNTTILFDLTATT